FAEPADPALEPVEVRRRGKVKRPDRGALRAQRPLAGAKRGDERLVEDGVLEQARRDLGERLLAALDPPPLPSPPPLRAVPPGPGSGSYALSPGRLLSILAARGQRTTGPATPGLP